MRGRITCVEGNVEIVSLPAGRRGDLAHAGNGGGRGPAPAPVGKLRQRPGPQLEKAQQAALTALAAVSSYLDADEELPLFFGRLSETVAGLVGARRAGFWRLGPRGVLGLQPRAFGFPVDAPIHSKRIERGFNGRETVDRIVFGDGLGVGGGTSSELGAMGREIGVAGIKNSIAVPWRAGERRIGAVVAFDSRRGF